MVFPIRPCFGALSELALAVLAERVHTDWWERDRARRVVGLWRDEAVSSVIAPIHAGAVPLPAEVAAEGCGRMVLVVKPAAIACGLACSFPAGDRGFDSRRLPQCLSQTPPSEEVRREQLRQAQAVVDQAKKVLMARFECGPAMAFELLRGASQYANVKVHVVAAQLIERGWDDDQENQR